MALSNSQYDAIMRGYDRRQYENYKSQLRRMDEVYARFPRIKEIDDQISGISLRQAERLYEGDTKALKTLKEELSHLRGERNLLLKEAGYPEDYLDMQYQCPHCKDTGFHSYRKCHCFLKEEIRLLYSSSHLDEILKKENFSTLRYDLYDEEQQKTMPAILSSVRSYVDRFGEERGNLLFYGSVGTGKSFLSNCIAKELLDRGYSVIYFTAFRFFELLAGKEQAEALLTCDLLILDDMGTELPNSYTVSKLFQILNERALFGRSCILSTNLSLQDFRDVYSERIFSRITSSYTLLKCTGGDLRIRKKLDGISR